MKKTDKKGDLFMHGIAEASKEEQGYFESYPNGESKRFTLEQVLAQSRKEANEKPQDVSK